MVRFDPTQENVGREILAYCEKHLIPVEHFLRIIYDQKVVPMLRGKGMEFSVADALEDVLDEREWSIQKLNLAAQGNAPDQDITLTHRRTGIQLKVESKSAVRASFKLGERAKGVNKGKAHFRVKSHRSRSNISKQGAGNDRYLATDFDVVISNPENSIYQGNTASESLELIHDKEAVAFLLNHYGVSLPNELPHAAYADWRFVFPRDIAEDGFIPRTPYVWLVDDPHWKPLNRLEEGLTALIQERRGLHSSR